MTRKILIVVLILAAAASGAAYYAFRPRGGGLVLTGIVATDEVIVSSQIGGEITNLRVDEGDPVRQGELLAVIDPSQYRADLRYYGHAQQSARAQVQQAEATLRYQELQTRDQVRQAQANVAAAKAQVAQATANLENARDNYRRTDALLEEGVLTAQQDVQARTAYDADRAAYQSAVKQVQSQQAALALAKSNEQQNLVRESELQSERRQWAASAAQTQKARVILDETQIRAPIDGVVDVRAALQGEVVNPGQAIVTLINPGNLWVSFDIPETYLDRIRVGDPLSVRFPSGMTQMGTVYFRGVDADYATERDVSRTKRDIKTFEIRLHVNNPDHRIWPGLTAFVTIPWKMLQVKKQ
jgi:HlyD family secretion protein